MGLQGTKTQDLFERAAKVIPYGVNSNFRYWGEEDTLVITKGEGAYVWDADGKRYIDYRLAFGPILLGHAFPAVNQAVIEAIDAGTLFAWTTPLEIQVAEEICKICKVDKVRLTNTGTEATMHALRIARAHTNRERFIKFEGQYHGMLDYFMFSNASVPVSHIGSRLSPINIPMTSGIPKDIHQYVINLPYNEPEILERTVKAKWGDLAAIIVEPIMGNMGSIMPRSGWLETIRTLCDQYGIALIMDEVKTGFRIAPGGAQEHFGVQADLVTYAKSLGNGFPIAAIAGKQDFMMTIEPGHMAHGGTYSGNAIGTAAAAATLRFIQEHPVHQTIKQRGKLLMSGIGEILTDAGLPNALLGVPSMFGFIVGTDQEPHDLRSYHACNMELYEHLSMELIRRGVQPDSDGREPWFVCYSHSDEDVHETLNIFEDAVKAVKTKDV